MANEFDFEILKHIGVIAGLAALPTAVIQLYRIVKETMKKHPVSI